MIAFRRLPPILALAAIVGSLGLAAQPAREPQPPMPYEDWDACPFEGCMYREWTALEPVAVRSARRTTAAIVFRLNTGDKVTALTGVVITTKPGRVRFVRPQDLDSSSGRIHIDRGQMLYLLTYQGEGFTKAWFDGSLYKDVDTASFHNGVCDVDPNQCSGKIVQPWQYEWWVQIRSRSGRVGWTNQPGKFDGKGSLG